MVSNWSRCKAGPSTSVIKFVQSITALGECSKQKGKCLQGKRFVLRKKLFVTAACIHYKYRNKEHSFKEILKVILISTVCRMGMLMGDGGATDRG